MNGLSLGPALSPAQTSEFRARLAFEHGKYDLHMGDRSTVSTRAILISSAMWESLARDAEALWSESAEAERAAIAEPILLRRLALPRRLRLEIQKLSRTMVSTSARFVRFDFHPTTDGWRISEVNADVPGGFLEAAALTSLCLEHNPGAEDAGDPCAAMARELASATPRGHAVALIHATAYTDDRQSMIALAARLSALDVPSILLAPDQMRSTRSRMTARDEKGATQRIGAIARFFPAEWLPNLASARAWRPLLGGDERCILNPAAAIVAQSKRMPLIWDHLGCPMPTWRRLLPLTQDPRSCTNLSEWALKPALGRVGEAVYLPGAQPLGERRAPRLARRSPEDWVAQQRFRAAPLGAEDSTRLYPCIGVFVLDGKTVGAYGRLSAKPLIDQHAQEAAVLITRAPESIAA